MFALSFRQLYRLSDKIIVRNLRNRKYAPGPNPGLDKRLTAFKEDGVKITDDDAEEFVEQSESDFYQAGEAYNEHLNETLMGKYELRHQIVKEKYFKENMPNLLTWSEKEQIRHLANTEPDEWTPEKIAEGFPVTVPVVKKLLKYPWKPATLARIARHDDSVMRNWRELKEGTIDIPEDMRQHFLKFSERKIPPLEKKSIKVDITQEEKLGEFERIIKKCAAKDEFKNEESTLHEEPEEKGSKKTKSDFNRMTLDELTAKIKNRLDKGNEIDMNDQILIDVVKSSNIESNNINKEIHLAEDKSQKELTEFKKKDASEDIMNYPERIRIPKKAYKKGATYKVNDCYYDHDGKFLYRVLGMSN